MKKSLFSLSSIMLGSVLVWGVFTAFTTAQATLPSISDLFKKASFWYTAESNISVDDIDTSTIILRSPSILDYTKEYVSIYRITYSLTGITDQTLLSEIKTKDVTWNNKPDDMILTLGIQDGLDATRTYYAMITPIEIYDALGTSSQQVCFNLSEERYELGDKCTTFEQDLATFAVTTPPTTEETHAAASTSNTDMSLANITHTVNGNTVTLRWTAIEGGGDIDIMVFNPQIEKYERLATVRMSDEKYDYTMRRDGEHIFRFLPLDGSKEYIYNIQAMRSETKEPEKAAEPVIKNPPKTGPVENMLVVLVLSIGSYVGYTYYRKKYH